MAADNVKNLNEWREASLEQWTDERIVDQEWVDAHIWFHLHSYADFAKSGLELIGWSCRQKHGDWLLVLKVLEGGTQQVGFITSATPTRCMLKVRKLLRNGGLSLYADRFA
jgi:hypothetical protein